MQIHKICKKQHCLLNPGPSTRRASLPGKLLHRWTRCIGDSEDVETLAEDEIAKLMDHRVETSRKTNNVKFMSLISQEDQEEATRACQDKRRKKKGVKTKTKK